MMIHAQTNGVSMRLPVFRVIPGALLMETLVRRGWKEDQLPKLRSICLTLHLHGVEG